MGSNVRMRRRSKNSSSSEAPTRMLSNSGVEGTHGRARDMHLKFMHHPHNDDSALL